MASMSYSKIDMIQEKSQVEPSQHDHAALPDDMPEDARRNVFMAAAECFEIIKPKGEDDSE